MPVPEMLSSAHKATGDFLRGDEEGLDWRWGYAAPTISSLAPGLFNAAYTKAVFNPLTKAPYKRTDGAMEKLKALAKSMNVDVMDGDEFARVSPTETKAQRNAMETIRNAPGVYRPFENDIVVNKNITQPHVLAHELGHAQGGKKLSYGNILGKNLMPHFAVGSGLAPTEEGSRNMALAGTAAMAPTLVSEIDASRRGAKILKNLGHTGMGRFKTYVGLPSYLAFSAVPWLSHMLKKNMGGFDKPQE